VKTHRLVFATLLLACGHLPALAGTPAWFGERDVFYQVFVRSFADSDGDRIGDFRGIEQHLPYLQRLGITSIVLTPVVPSRYYHNYFASRFDDVDPAYGDMASFRRLVRAAHTRHMRIYLDQEIQYVAPEHPWWSDSAGNPRSRFSPYVLYNGTGNTDPEAGFLDGVQALTYDGQAVRLAVVNLKSDAVRRYFDDLFVWWLRQGVDGFRIDHMMDDLDDKGKLTDLVQGFWNPLLAHARAAQPRLGVIAEQSDWKYGDDLLRRGGADLVYAFPLREAIVSLDPARIVEAIRATQARTPPRTGQLVFLENHDTNRFASEVGNDPAKERAGAALCVLLKGAPLIYYGQELGMRGRRVPAGPTDGNDIPNREAFRWTRRLGDPGTATWYRDTGPWWDARYSHDGDGVSVEEEDGDPTSLLSYYRTLLRLRRERPELLRGDQTLVDLGQPALIGIRRTLGPAVALLVVNLSAGPARVRIPSAAFGRSMHPLQLRDLLGDAADAPRGAVADLGPYGVRVLVRR
jgi:glycosidase